MRGPSRSRRLLFRLGGGSGASDSSASSRHVRGPSRSWRLLFRLGGGVRSKRFLSQPAPGMSGEKIQGKHKGKYKGITKEIQRNTKEIQRKYKGKTKEIQRQCKAIAEEMQKNEGNTKGNTKEIPVQYKGNTKENYGNT